MSGLAWDRLKELFERALDLPAEARLPFLTEACGADVALRAEAEALLRAHDAAGGFLETPAAAQVPLSAAGESESLIGRSVGPFRVIAEIGRGGMGAVYRALREAGDYTQEVAIKIVPAGLASAGFTARFRQERRILARLEHPNIARLIDGGTTDDGRPYYAMELVDGRPLDRYCVEQGLGLRARLELFRVVCNAVAYAHRSLVVHRDLKPGNILVSADGAPKLLDFGIAKLLSSEDGADSGLTGTGMPLMTPDYASPEQVRGDPVTTSTDVYALGVLLYVLLTNRRPYELTTRSPEEIVRLVCHEEPRAPSAIATAARRGGGDDAGRGPAAPSWRIDTDLDTIALKAVRKEPERRYESAADLSEDVRRYLAGLPVQARPDTVRYRTSRFIRRHRGAVAAATAALLFLVGGVIATFWEARIAEANRQRAERRFEDLRQLARSNLFELHDAIEPLAGSATARNLLIQRSLQYLDRLNAETTGRRDLQEEIAAGYQRIAQLQGNFSGPGIGDSKAAVESYAKALTLREALVAGRPGDVAGLLGLSGLLVEYAYTLLTSGRVADASGMARRALDSAEQAARVVPDRIEVLRARTLAHLQLAYVMGGSGSSGSTREIAAAVDHNRRALATLSRLADLKDPRARAATLAYESVLAFHLQKARAFDESARVFDAILSSQRTAPVLAPDRLALVHNNRGLMHERAGNERKALADYQAAFVLGSRTSAADSSNLLARVNLAINRAHVGMQTARLGQPAAGKRQLDAAIETVEALLRDNPSRSFYANLLTIGYSYQAEVLSMLGDQRGAQAKYLTALAMASDVSRAEPDDLESPLSICKLHAALGVVLGRAARYAEARRAFDTARERTDAFLRLRQDDAEAAYVAQLVRDNTAALEGCAEGQVCSGSRRLRLPTLLN